MGKSGPDTSGQNEAAKMNAEIAKEVWENYKQTYLPMEKQYVADAQNYDTPEHREQAAERASADVEQAYSTTQGERARDMEGMGIRPDDAKFQAINARLMRDKVAQQAGAQNTARQQVEQEGWNRRTGALSLGKGLPAQASGAATRAGQIYGDIANQEANADNNAANGIAQGAGAAYSIWKGGFADGGLVNTKKLRLAMGGPAGLDEIMANQGRIPTAPRRPGSGIAQNLIQGARTGQKIAEMGKALMNHGAATAEMVDAPAAGATMDVGGLDAAQTASEALTPGIADAGAADTGIGAAIGDAAATDAAATAGTAAAADAAAAGTTAAAGEAAAAGSAAAGSTGIMAAMGPLGWAGLAALGISALLRADGGSVDGEAGGKVRGPGTETSDSIPAMLSDGEYVLNAEAVKHFGLDKLEKMNQVGLQKRYGIRK